MARGHVAGLHSPHPLAERLPAVLQEDAVIRAFMAGLDELVAPVLATLDCLHAYVDPALTPDDFLTWLGGWVATEPDETCPSERRRVLVQRAVSLYQRRGTARGIMEHIELYAGGTVEIAETGGVAWSQQHGTSLPGEPVPRLAVRLTVDDPSAVSDAAVERLVEACKPAHVVHRVEVVGR
jgi:phage tail-like protein